MRLDLLDSAKELEAHAPAWDDLWQRSRLVSPAFRATLIRHWLTQFAPTAPFRAILVWDDDRLVAALPLVGGHWVAATPNNPWSCCGELLMDPDSPLQTVARQLLRGFRNLPWPFVLLRSVRIDSPPWQALRFAVAQAKGPAAFAHSTHAVGRVDLTNDYDAYWASRSSNHRRHMRKADRRIEREGGGELRVLDQLPPGEVRAALQQGFEVEDRSWKGAAGSSVLRTPGMFDYYVRQAEQLAAWNQLCLAFLVHRDQPIAFAYGWRAKQTFLTPKIGYSAEHARFSPGQLLFAKLFRYLAAAPRPPVVDFDGPLADATGKWTTETYRVGHIALSPRPLTGRGWVGGYRLLRSAKQRRVRQP